MKTRQELVYKMQQTDFWDDNEKAKEITKKEKELFDEINEIEEISKKLSDLKELSSIFKEDESMLIEVQSDVENLYKEINLLEIKTLFSGKYDENDAFLTLKSGVGGTDAMDWTEMLLRMYKRWADKKGFDVEIISIGEGDEAGIREATLKISGRYVYGFLKSEKGIHRLVRISPFNASGKRQTSFASVEPIPLIENNDEIEIKDEDIRIDTYRSSGAGGQHVNVTDSAVRITHIESGIVVSCQNERSQHQNKETAMSVLISKLTELEYEKKKKLVQDISGEQKNVGWGSQIRSYTFNPYSLVKDHRTNAENSNVGAVMDGDIDIFINEYLKYNS